MSIQTRALTAREEPHEIREVEVGFVGTSVGLSSNALASWSTIVSCLENVNLKHVTLAITLSTLRHVAHLFERLWHHIIEN